MCGISCFFARESVPDFKVIDTLFKGMMNRGTDGFGCAWIHNDKNRGRYIKQIIKSPKNYDDGVNVEHMKYIHSEMNIGDVLIGIQRAQPETEPAVDSENIEKTMQPICSDKQNLVVVHNGAVMKRIHEELKTWAQDSGEYAFGTEIDSESILAAYVKYRSNMKSAMEYLSGGFALIMFDELKDCLYICNDHMQLSQGYSKTIGGYMLHSENEVLTEIIESAHGCTKNGVCVWENFYNHYFSGHNIYHLDLPSGFLAKQKFTPRYIVGNTFDSKRVE